MPKPGDVSPEKITEMADEMMDKYDTVRNGVWSFDEFKHWLKANPKVF
jgi:hypothetical protein